MRDSFDPLPVGILSKYRVCGVSFQQSPVEVRERIAVPPGRLPEALRFLREQPGVRECMVLSTCNRTELYLSVDEWVDATELFIRFARALLDFDLGPISDQIYVLQGQDAVMHSFRVASSLDSLVLGEPQILGQTKAAFREAENQGCVDRELHRWIPRAFAAAKRVRSETGISEAAVSVSYAAVQLARKIFEDLAGKSVLLLGAGKMCELAALHLKEGGASSIVVANRTLARGEELAGKCCGMAVEFERRWEEIAAADVIICSTDAPHYILDAEGVSRMVRKRPRKPLLILDIAVPRNVDPAVASVEGVYLFNIDDLENVVEANRKNRENAAVLAESVLRSALAQFLKEEGQAQVAPAIAAMRNQVRSICMSELQRFEKRTATLSDNDRKEIEMMLHRIAQKIVHPAIMELKALESQGGGCAEPGLIVKLFGIDRETSPC
jgi:glutamyl-tRNA reductase